MGRYTQCPHTHEGWPAESRDIDTILPLGARDQPHQNAAAMTPYNASMLAPSAQVDSPSNVMKTAMRTAMETAAMSIGGNTSVRVANPKTLDRITSSGASTRAIWSGDWMITENAYSLRFWAARCTPPTFSIAFPAIATTTRPAKASEM